MALDTKKLQEIANATNQDAYGIAHHYYEEVIKPSSASDSEKQREFSDAITAAKYIVTDKEAEDTAFVSMVQGEDHISPLQRMALSFSQTVMQAPVAGSVPLPLVQSTKTAQESAHDETIARIDAKRNELAQKYPGVDMQVVRQALEDFAASGETNLDAFLGKWYKENIQPYADYEQSKDAYVDIFSDIVTYKPAPKRKQSEFYTKIKNTITKEVEETPVPDYIKTMRAARETKPFAVSEDAWTASYFVNTAYKHEQPARAYAQYIKAKKEFTKEFDEETYADAKAFIEKEGITDPSDAITEYMLHTYSVTGIPHDRRKAILAAVKEAAYHQTGKNILYSLPTVGDVYETYRKNGKSYEEAAEAYYKQIVEPYSLQAGADPKKREEIRKTLYEIVKLYKAKDATHPALRAITDYVLFLPFTNSWWTTQYTDEVDAKTKTDIATFLAHKFDDTSLETEYTSLTPKDRAIRDIGIVGIFSLLGAGMRSGGITAKALVQECMDNAVLFSGTATKAATGKIATKLLAKTIARDEFNDILMRDEAVQTIASIIRDAADTEVKKAMEGNTLQEAIKLSVSQHMGETGTVTGLNEVLDALAKVDTSTKKRFIEDTFAKYVIRSNVLSAEDLATIQKAYDTLDETIVTSPFDEKEVQKTIRSIATRGVPRWDRYAQSKGFTFLSEMENIGTVAQYGMLTHSSDSAKEAMILKKRASDILVAKKDIGFDTLITVAKGMAKTRGGSIKTPLLDPESILKTIRQQGLTLVSTRIENEFGLRGKVLMNLIRLTDHETELMASSMITSLETSLAKELTNEDKKLLKVHSVRELMDVLGEYRFYKDRNALPRTGALKIKPIHPVLHDTNVRELLETKYSPILKKTMDAIGDMGERLGIPVTDKIAQKTIEVRKDIRVIQKGGQEELVEEYGLYNKGIGKWVDEQWYPSLAAAEKAKEALVKRSFKKMSSYIPMEIDFDAIYKNYDTFVREVMKERSISDIIRDSEFVEALTDLYDEDTITKAYAQGQLSALVEKAARELGSYEELYRRTLFKTINKYQMRNAERLYGHLQYSRVTWIPDKYYKTADYSRILRSYILNASKRLVEYKNYGRNDTVIRALIDSIGKDSPEGGVFLNRFYDMLFGKYAYNKQADKLVQAAKDYQSLTKLALSGLAQIQQIAFAPTRGSFVSFVKGVRGLMREGHLKDMMRQTGTILTEIRMQAIRDNYDIGRVAEKAVTLYGIPVLDRVSRKIASATGYHYLEEIVEKFIANPKKYERYLVDLHINPAELIKQNFTITDDMYRKAMQKFEIDTNFRSKVYDLPEFASTRFGKLMTHLMTTQIQQTKFVKKYVWDELKHGNVKPLVIFLSMGAATAIPRDVIRSLLNGEGDYSPNVIELWLDTGVLGVAGQQISSLRYGFAPIGVTFGSIVNISKAIGYMSQAEMGRALYQLSKEHPVVSKILFHETYAETARKRANNHNPFMPLKSSKKFETFERL